MKKFAVILAFTANTHALEAAKDNKTQYEQSIWGDAKKNIYVKSDDKMCKKHADCTAKEHFCVQHLWEYNKQFEGGQGCWHQSVCKGTGTFLMLDDRKLQYFCDQKVHDAVKAAGGDYGKVPYNGIRYQDAKFYQTWKEGCVYQEDCKKAYGEKSYCTFTRWDSLNNDAKSGYANSSSCYTWSKDVCPKGDKTPTFGIINKNFAKSYGFSYYVQNWCAPNKPKTGEVGFDCKKDAAGKRPACGVDQCCGTAKLKVADAANTRQTMDICSHKAHTSHTFTEKTLMKGSVSTVYTFVCKAKHLLASVSAILATSALIT